MESKQVKWQSRRAGAEAKGPGIVGVWVRGLLYTVFAHLTPEERVAPRGWPRHHGLVGFKPSISQARCTA